MLASLSSLLVAALTAAHTLTTESTRLSVEPVAVHLPGWPAEGEPARVVLLADLHATRSDAARMDAVVQQVLRLRPHAVLLLGDYGLRHEPARSMPAAELARRLAPLQKQCAVYYVCGNHDDAAPASLLRRAFDARGFVFAESREIRLRFPGGRRARLQGCPHRSERQAPYVPAPPARGRQAQPHLPLIVAVHSPWHHRQYALAGNLVVAGHTHGGQVCWPGGRPIFRRGCWTRELMQGGLQHGKAPGQQLYVSRGIGTSSVPVRLGCRPEITLLLLNGTAPQK